MKHIFFLVLLIQSIDGYAGDEFTTPKLEDSSGYRSLDLKFTLIGVERNNEDQISYWVVADPEAVSAQNRVNEIVKSIYKKRYSEIHSAANWRINFYAKVHQLPPGPSFRITEALALYNSEQNKIRFMSGS